MKKIELLILSAVLVFVAADPVLAEEAAATGGNGALGAAIAIGLAALGGTLGQSNAVRAALDSIGRNPSAAGKVFTPMILGLALIESLVLFAFVIAYLIKNL